MGDHAYATLLVWPYPGREQLPDAVVDALTLFDALPETDDPVNEHHHHTDDDALVLTGDDASGPVLAIVETDASGGIEAFRALITALNVAGLAVIAANESAPGVSAAWEHHPAGDTPVDARRVEDGEFVVAASDLTCDAFATLDQLPDTALAERARRLLNMPDGIPATVKKVSL